MKRNQSTTVALIAFAVLLLTTPAVAADNNIGTWKLNLAKTTHSPGPPPKSHTVNMAAWGEDGIKYTADGVSAEGKPTHSAFQAKYDGKDYPFENHPGHTVAYKRMDSNTVQVTTKMDGKVTITAKITVSADGKTRTIVQTGTDSHGRKVNSTWVYDKE